jgi:hypothetical protein
LQFRFEDFLESQGVFHRLSNEDAVTNISGAIYSVVVAPLPQQQRSQLHSLFSLYFEI